jgi:RNA polymerase sigma-70 factor (ECF subfamily)
MRALHQAHAKPLYHFLLRLALGDRELAEDLLQDTMLRVWRKLDVLPADIQVVRPWLFTVARNIAIDSARARQARPVEIETGDAAWVSAPTDAVEGMLTARTVREALLKLSPEHRAVLLELYYRGASVAETAARIGIPDGTVRSRSYYALRALRSIMRDTEPR